MTICGDGFYEGDLKIFLILILPNYDERLASVYERYSPQDILRNAGANNVVITDREGFAWPVKVADKND